MKLPGLLCYLGCLLLVVCFVCLFAFWVLIVYWFDYLGLLLIANLFICPAGCLVVVLGVVLWL